MAPLSQSRQHYTPFKQGESHDVYEERTWREKCHYDENGIIYVPAMAFKQCLDAAATRLSIPDPDSKKARLTKFFVSDVFCEQNMSIGIKKDEIGFVRINAHVDGNRTSGKRVLRTLPQTPQWQGVTSFVVLEPKINHDVFTKVIKYAGRSIGVGQFRPSNGGLNGRYEITNIKFEDIIE
jgi:hypothetical protein